MSSVVVFLVPALARGQAGKDGCSFSQEVDRWTDKLLPLKVALEIKAALKI